LLLLLLLLLLLRRLCLRSLRRYLRPLLLGVLSCHVGLHLLIDLGLSVELGEVSKDDP
jgi:hypothetical protein